MKFSISYVRHGVTFYASCFGRNAIGYFFLWQKEETVFDEGYFCGLKASDIPKVMADMIESVSQSEPSFSVNWKDAN